MITQETYDALLKLVSDLAKVKIAVDNDDFMVDDYAGGNIDDAYALGERAGEVQLARDIKDMLT